jgi:hypothetical protein
LFFCVWFLVKKGLGFDCLVSIFCHKTLNMLLTVFLYFLNNGYFMAVATIRYLLNHWQ